MSNNPNILDVGSIFSERFHILKKEAVGGTASVYQAFDKQLQKTVALKIFNKNNASPEVTGEIWNRETKALQKLNHYAIVNFIDAGRDRDNRFIVTEWLDGNTLEKVLNEKGKFSWDEFYEQFGKIILDALCYAFGEDISHRDLSVRNIFILHDNSVKIIDFGQAKIEKKEIGLTLAAWKTVPYSPPEEDTGRYTYTRDPYSISAIFIRALHGEEIENHDDLYDAYKEVDLPESYVDLINKGLSRNPEERPENIIKFCDLLSKKEELEVTTTITLPIRCATTVSESLNESVNPDYENGFEELLVELSEAVSVGEVKEFDNSQHRIELETQSYRMVVDIDSYNKDHLVVVSIKIKSFRLDSLYSERYWHPDVLFTKQIPRTSNEKNKAKEKIIKFYSDFEDHISLQSNKTYLGRTEVFDEWNRLLDALRFIARTTCKPINYISKEIDGRRINFEIEEVNNITEGEVRNIYCDGRRVFSGEVEEVENNICKLYSVWPSFRVDSIPNKGDLEIDWTQSRVSLDRQRRALDAFAEDSIPNKSIKELITLEKNGEAEPLYSKVDKYYDNELDQDKKLIVSQFLNINDLLLVHGPPGTGKTRLIVELVRQQIKQNKDSKILLVSQTHVAIDNALEPLLDDSLSLSVVRIGSGSKELSNSVKECSMEERSSKFISEVKENTNNYVKEVAEKLGVDMDEVSMGLKANEFLKLKIKVNDKSNYLEELKSDVTDTKEKLNQIINSKTTSKEETALKAKARTLDDNVTLVSSEFDSLVQQLKVAKEGLIKIHEDGKELSKMEEEELQEWCDELINKGNRKKLSQIMEMTEDWTLQFSGSDDFKVALIANANIVAGTCVGFCKEKAALLLEFDLCIVDEASKATTTELLVPMAQAKKVILVGDHHQLPAVIDHALNDSDIQKTYSLSAKQLKYQLFEALQIDLLSGNKAAISIQHRMRESIGDLISECFYDGLIKNGNSISLRKVPDLSLAGLTKEVTWFDTDPNSNWNACQKSSGKSLINTVEIDCILLLLKRLLFVFNQSDEKEIFSSKIGIISGYSEQAILINREISKLPELDTLSIICDTVHAFQGRQVDICIYSITRNNSSGDIGFLQDWRHLNVALSRAKNYLVIVGGLTYCRIANEPNPFLRLVEYISTNNNCEIKAYYNV